MKEVVAKFTVQKVTQTMGQEEITAIPVCDDGTAENKSFAKYTPAGKLELTVDNEAVHGFFVPGGDYRVTIEKVES